MRRNRHSWVLGATGLLVVLLLIVGCRPQRSASPGVTPTSASGAQVGPGGTPGVIDDAQANSAEATQTAMAWTPVPTEAPTLAVPTATPSPTPEPVVIEPATPTPGTSLATPTPVPTGTVTHVVQPGENLFRIALRYGTTVEAIAAANGIANPSLIHVGQTLRIPSSGGTPGSQTGSDQTYVVQPGDNLFRIALRYNMNYLQLAQYNGIVDPSRIYVGQVIRIPSH